MDPNHSYPSRSGPSRSSLWRPHNRFLPQWHHSPQIASQSTILSLTLLTWFPRYANFMQPWLTPICHGHVSVLVLILHRTKILHITVGKKCQSFMNSNSKSWKLLLVTDTKSFRKHVFKKLISKKHEVTSIKVNTLSLLLKIWVPHIANIMNLFVFLIKNTER